MRKFEGTPGTKTSLALRVLQCVFSISAIAVISSIHIKILSSWIYPLLLWQLLWGLCFCILDAAALWTKRQLHNRWTVFPCMIGDWLIVFASLGAASVAADILDLYIDDGPSKDVAIFQIYIVLLFLGWIPNSLSAFILLWIVPAMSLSGPDVHPMVEPLPVPPVDVQANMPVMKDLQGLPATIGGAVFRLTQFFIVAVSFIVMTTDKDFPTAKGFRYLLVVICILCPWSLSMAILDIYAISVGRRFMNLGIMIFFAIGDWVTSILVFTATCGYTGVIYALVDLQLYAPTHCVVDVMVLAWVSWLLGFISFIFKYWYLASI